MFAPVDAVSGGAVLRSDLVGRRYRLTLTAGQEQRLAGWSGALRALWNAALQQRRDAWRDCRVSVGVREQCRDLTAARAEIPWLADVPAQTAQQTLRDLDRAFDRFFARQSRYPRFRSRRRDPGLRFPQGVEIRRVNRRWGEVKLAKLGWVRFRWSRAPGGLVRHATVSRDAFGWHLSLCVALPPAAAVVNSGCPVGVDRGAVVQAALSTGELVGRDQYLHPKERERLRRLERRRERQRRDSVAQQRTKRQISRMRGREARRRRDQTHKLTTRLARGHSLVAIEDLNTRAMTRSAKGSPQQSGRRVAQKRGMNRAILDRGWAQVERQLEYKTVRHGAQLVRVPARNTSITCACCNIVDHRSRESQARFRCRHCGHSEHADINAARVILARALNHPDQPAGGPSVTARGDLQVKSAGSVKREPTRQRAAV
jgi:putative transposase